MAQRRKKEENSSGSEWKKVSCRMECLKCCSPTVSLAVKLLPMVAESNKAKNSISAEKGTFVSNVSKREGERNVGEREKERKSRISSGEKCCESPPTVFKRAERRASVFTLIIFTHSFLTKESLSFLAPILTFLSLSLSLPVSLFPNSFHENCFFPFLHPATCWHLKKCHHRHCRDSIPSNFFITLIYLNSCRRRLSRKEYTSNTHWHHIVALSFGTTPSIIHYFYSVFCMFDQIRIEDKTRNSM